MPVLTDKEEAFLSWITDSNRFTIETVLSRHAGTVRLRDLVTTDPEIMRGVPVFAGTRVPIDIVLASVARGTDWNRLVASYPFLTDDHVVAAKAVMESRYAMSPRQADIEAGLYDYPHGYFVNVVRQDRAAHLEREGGQQAVVQYLYNEIGRCVAAGIGAKK